jgi:hypothetical protein
MIMIRSIKQTAIITIFAVASAGPALAKKPDFTGKSERYDTEYRDDHSDLTDAMVNSLHNYFNDDRKRLVRNYYSQHKSAGHCPPGLAKKNNGCLPPGQVKKWRKGHQLPEDFVYDDLPRALLRELGRTPDNYKVVRNDRDLLLIDIGTRMVIDAFENF